MIQKAWLGPPNLQHMDLLNTIKIWISKFVFDISFKNVYHDNICKTELILISATTSFKIRMIKR